MKERPIIMSGPNIRPILDGIKTQTRRVVKAQPPTGWDRHCWYDYPIYGWTSRPRPSDQWHTLKSFYGKEGDRLWVKEAWRTLPDADSIPPRDLMNVEPYTHYEADGSSSVGMGKLRPSIFMPRWASRILLEITEIRVERLQDISEEDAREEGILLSERSIYPESNWPEFPTSYKDGYEHLWESIHGSGSWDVNPYVWCISFKRVTS